MLDKIIKRKRTWLITFVILSTSFSAASQQDTGLIVISKFKLYKQQVAEDPSKKMVELKIKKAFIPMKALL